MFHCVAGMQVDPTLSRTVMVSTKFDTRIPQFAIAADAEAFLHPSAALLMDASMLGKAPFFTSVPSGRVGNAKDAIFRRYVSLDRSIAAVQNSTGILTMLLRDCCSVSSSYKEVVAAASF
jgi:hypothetical protein